MPARMSNQANIKGFLESEAQEDEGTAALPVELDAIPGAVWQAELQSLMPPDVRVSLFEQGGRKCAVLRFPSGEVERAREAFVTALQGANEVSEQAHVAAKAALEARAQAKRGKQAPAEPQGRAATDREA